MKATELLAKSVFRLRLGDRDGAGIFVTVTGGAGLLAIRAAGLALLIETTVSALSLTGLDCKAFWFFFMAYARIYSISRLSIFR